ncbi:MAG: hypothetical protein HQL22_01940 [Candidatus Omnitrophica bacterium]|nr:hypothetical protein [Candidatus Omnitrophota bacterium]
MIKAVRYGQQPFSSSGVSLLEVSLVITAIGLSCVYLSGIAHKRSEQARSMRTINEMIAILDAGQEYYALNGKWPEDINAVGQILTQLPSGNGWNKPYELSHGNTLFSVVTEVPEDSYVPNGPAAVVNNLPRGKRWQMSRSVSYGCAARLAYEK